MLLYIKENCTENDPVGTGTAIILANRGVSSCDITTNWRGAEIGLHRCDVSADPVITDINELQSMPDNVSAIRNSPTTKLGKRDAYNALCSHLRQEHLIVNFDFFAFLSTFRVSMDVKAASRSVNSKIAPLGSYQFNVDAHKWLTNAKTFTLHGVSTL